MLNRLLTWWRWRKARRQALVSLTAAAMEEQRLFQQEDEARRLILDRRMARRFAGMEDDGE